MLASEFVVCLSDHIEDIFGHFENIQRKINVGLSEIFKTAQTLISDVEEIHLPRLTPCQLHRSNYSTKDPESYFRVWLAIPILGDLIDQLKCRFSDHKDLLGTLQCFIPTSTTETIDVKSLKLYENLVDLELVSGEYLLWKLVWEKMEQDKLSCAIEATENIRATENICFFESRYCNC
ncbi:hypothetical protein QYM36_011611 [Artemia franciscana]|uniref:Uncharacterized protein n=1 Tax=Artemia franciscana TaxID=6661 RepID=A0AA88HNY8_ARTSF|nr:hypothetical protein QYM36_011611 [Artemia franciscana]